jgi:hypothetical protein
MGAHRTAMALVHPNRHRDNLGHTVNGLNHGPAPVLSQRSKGEADPGSVL